MLDQRALQAILECASEFNSRFRFDDVIFL
jgi:hypothetical protein